MIKRVIFDIDYTLLNPNYDTQSKLNNNRVVKCKISKNGNIDNIDCQTIY